MVMKRTCVLLATLPVFLCSIGIAQADVMNYEFLCGRSTVVQTGGFAGVNITYPIQGEFSLRRDAGGGAVFEDVDAELGPPEFWYSLGELFNMTELTGFVVDATNIKFVGLTQGGIRGVKIRIDVTLQNNLAVLTGEFDQNDLVNDGFRYELSAVGRLHGTARPGDTDGNDIVDGWDCNNLVAQFGGTPGADSADFNGDGIVGLEDFAILRSHFGSGVASAPDARFGVTAPEPATLILMAGGLPLLLKRKRRE